MVKVTDFVVYNFDALEINYDKYIYRNHLSLSSLSELDEEILNTAQVIFNFNKVFSNSSVEFIVKRINETIQNLDGNEVASTATCGWVVAANRYRDKIYPKVTLDSSIVLFWLNGNK